ncbi:MAG: cation-translocating P-type ATPase [Infirmifilum sp.]
MDSARLDWHAMPIEKVLEMLETARTGLSDEEARRRLETYGPNRLEEEKKISPLRLFLNQFINPLTALLLFATILSLFIGETVDALVIIVLVFAGAVLGFYQEYRAEKALEALKKMSSPSATVLRGNRVKVIKSEEIVPGDILVLTAGDRVAADARLIETNNLRVNEAILTGESAPVEKTLDVLAPDVPLAERTNMVYAGTAVVYGKGKAVVVATGKNTQLGRIAESLEEVKAEKTPLEKQLDTLGKTLLFLMVIVASLVSLVGLMFWKLSFIDLILWATSLAVAAVPEALPVVVTSSLAIGVYKMAKRNAIVRRLPAVETLGSTTYICSDKTGTMTKGEMTVVKVWVFDDVIEVTGSGYEPIGKLLDKGQPVDTSRNRALELLLINAFNNNDSQLVKEDSRWTVIGDTTEGALKVLATKAGVTSRLERIGEIPFSSERKRMSTLHTWETGTVMFVKGAPEVLLPLSSKLMLPSGEIITLTEENLRKILEINDAFAQEGLRNIAFAVKFFNEKKEQITEADEQELIFLGITAIIDPPRPEVLPALETCEQAGIKVAMITGDHKLTAVSIAKQLGMMNPDDIVVTGQELEKMNDTELEEKVEKIRVFARVSPEHKLRIVRSLKKKGHIVAMTGDGVNDAPALKAADVGVAMGITGSEVAKEAASVVLADDNFATIVEAVKLGREIFENIRKYLVYLLSANIAELLTPLFATFLGLPIPFTATQILWVNLVTDGAPAIALSLEPGEPGLLVRKPRKPNSPIFSRSETIAFLVLIPLVLSLELVLLFRSLLTAGIPEIEARTTLFTAMILAELLLAYLYRSLRTPVYKLPPQKNKILLFVIVASFLIQLGILTFHPMQKALDISQISIEDFEKASIVLISLLALVEVSKILIDKLERKNTKTTII